MFINNIAICKQRIRHYNHYENYNYPPRQVSKRLAVAFLLLLAVCFGLQAEPITPERARALAGKYISISTSKNKLKSVRKSTSDRPYYIYEGDNGRGFVIVSGDDALGEVIAYSREGRLDTAKTSFSKAYLKSFTEDYKAYRKSGKAAIAPRAKHYGKVIGPLIKSQWDQNAPFNCMLPNNYPLTGCGPTAMAQLMYYHRWPEHGQGSNSYKNYDETVMEADFSKSHYDYDNMMPRYSYVEEQVKNEAVGLLVRDCGIASGAMYTRTWAGSFEYDICKSLNNNFFYTSSLFYVANYGTQRMYDMVVSEIVAGFPVIMAGGGRDGSGHVFIADGVDENGLVHYNFGWRGMDDGYYGFPCGMFRPNADAIFARPNKSDSKPLPTILRQDGPHLMFTGTGIMQIKDMEDGGTTARPDKITVRMCEFKNHGAPFRGDLGIAVVDEKGNTLGVCGSREHDKGGFTTRLSDGTLMTDGLFTDGNDVFVDIDIAKLKAGYYQLKAVNACYSDAAKSYGEWVDVLAYPRLEVELTDANLRVSEQGGRGKGFQLAGNPVWSQELLNPGDRVTVMLPVDNLSGVDSDGVLAVSITDPKANSSYLLGESYINVARFYTDTLKIDVTIPAKCEKGVYTLQLSVDNNVVKQLHDAQPTYVSIGGISTGINQTRQETTTNGLIYDLQGRRVASPQNGIYIIDGKKQVVKNSSTR